MMDAFARWRRRRMAERESARLATHDPEWHRKAVGGLWEEVGEVQFRFLVDRGLRPEHELLDIGCGSLRGGVRFVAYLEPGHYTGIDLDDRLLAAGRGELRRRGLVDRRPTLVQMGDFDFPSLGKRFDFAIAQSVFTHLPLNSIARCLLRVDEVLVPGGRLYATFFENPRGRRNLDPVAHPTVDVGDLMTYSDRDPFHYDVDAFRWICEGTQLDVAYLGDWGHPRDQKMVAFTRRTSEADG